jgi:hypothetical protein
MATYSPLGKFPSWVADTFRSWWIWMPWLYSSFDYTHYVLPSIPPNRWNGMVCGQFLKSRGYPAYTKLNAREKQEIVKTMSQQIDWPPLPVVPPGSAVTGEDRQTMLWHCHALLKNLFAEPHMHVHRNAASVHAKLLLSSITQLDRKMQVDDNPPNSYEVK